MADIFVSYARADKARVAPLVAALEAQGWSVWWDTEIVGGQEFDALITREIEAARAAIVVWTPASVGSRWVRGEARLAADRGVLAPVQFDAPSLPLDFRAIHTIEFDSWSEDARSRPFQDLLRAVRALVGGAARLAEAAPAPRGVSICVLPFANMSGDPEQEYFADGISEDIITDLSKVSALWVAARNTAFTFKGKHVDVPQVARQLKVSHVLEGSVRKAGNRVRITAQLIEGETGGHVWAERYDRDLDDIFALQDEIAQAIVAALKLRLFPEEKKAIEDRDSTSLEAYDKYLRARALIGNMLTPDDLVRASGMLREVLEIDPEFAPARGALAMAYAYTLIFLPESSAQTLEEMDVMVQEALARAPDQWGSHLANAIRLAVRHDWLAADAAFAGVVALAPPSQLGVRSLFAQFLLSVGRGAEAIQQIEAARNADPLSSGLSTMLQQALDVVGRPDDAQAEYERARDLPGGREVQEHSALFRIWRSGDTARIKAQFQHFLDHALVPVPVLAEVREVIDQPAAVLALLRAAYEDPAYQDRTRLGILAWWAALYGDNELAVAAMRRGYVDRRGLVGLTIWLPVLREVHRTEGFKQLLRDLGLYDYWRTSGKWGDFARPVGEDDFECW